MGIRISFVALAAPLILLALLLAAPGVDKSWGTSSFHFYVVSSASLLAAGTCVVLVISARSIRQTRILFLALSFFSLATIFSVHGLATPGHLLLWEDEWRRLRTAAGESLPVVAVSDAAQPARGHLALVAAPAGALVAVAAPPG